MKRIITIILIILTYGFIKNAKGQFGPGQWLDAGIDLHDPGTNPFQADKWELVFEDKFDGFSGYPDPNLWDVSDGGKDFGGSGSVSTYKKHNVWVNQGICTLTLKKEQATWNGENFDYTSGEIATKIDWDNGPIFMWEYGMFQARIKMPKAYWSHSNFWIYSDRKGEIDIAEVSGRFTDRVPTTIHNAFECTDPLQSINCNNYLPLQNPLTTHATDWVSESPQLGFHTYTCIWDKYNIYFYYEVMGAQHLLMRIPKLLFSEDGNPFTATEFLDYTTRDGYYWLRPCFFPLNEAGGVILHTFLDKSYPIGAGKKKLRIKQDAALPAKMEIDWVRVYKRRKCSQSEEITNSNLFPYHHIFLKGPHSEKGNSSDKTIVLGTNNSLSWSNIVQPGGNGLIEGETIILLPNYIAKPDFADYTPCRDDDNLMHWNNYKNHGLSTTWPPLSGPANDIWDNTMLPTAYTFQPRLCIDPNGLEEVTGYIEPETDTISNDTLINLCEYIDTAWVDSAIYAHLTAGDTLSADSIISLIVDSLGCEYWGYGEGGENKPGKRGSSSSRAIQYLTAKGKNHIDNIRIYPNPTTGAFNIEIPQRGSYTIRVMNMLGSTVYEGKMADEQKKSIQLDNNLPPGNYTLHISGDGLRHVERITLTK